MAEPPVDLSKFVVHSEILQALDTPVKEQLPAVTVCPLCDHESLHIYAPPGDHAGRWHFCNFCDFAGDTIELYHAASGLDTIREAIHDLVERELLKKEEGDPTGEDIQKYLAAHVQKRARIRDLFKKMQAQLVTWLPEWTAIMHAHNLWGGGNSVAWHRMLGRFIGGATHKDWRAARLTPLVPRGFHNSLVIPYYDVPGRISSFLLVSRRDTARMYLTASEHEDGLMMLDTLAINDDEPVYATSDPIIALQMQGRSFSTDERPLKMVVYGPGTSTAWQSVSARRLIFWDDFNYRLFSQARKYPRAYVAHRLAFVNRNDRFKARGLPVILHSLNTNTYTWAEAMRDFILEEDAAVVGDALAELKLEAHERNRIYEVTPSAQRGKLRERLSEMPVTTGVVIDKVRIEEDDYGWWAVYKDRRELASNVIIRVNEAVHIEGTDQNSYKGTLQVGGKTTEFEVDMKLAEQRTFDWLQKEMMENGLGAPAGARRFRAKLIEIAKRFREPQFVQRFNAFGWDPDTQRFTFPNFSIHEGKLDDSACGVGAKAKNIPASNLTMAPLSDGDWDILLQNEPWWAMSWATLACFMTNLAAPILGLVPQTVGLIGGMGSAASVMGRHLADELGMLPIGTGKARSKYIWEGTVKSLNTYNYPVWLDVDDMGKFDKVASHADRHNAMTSVPYLSAAALMVGESWVFVNAPQIIPRRNRLPRLTGVMRFLSWWQAHGFSVPSGTSMQGGVLQQLQTWADEELKALDLGVFKTASEMLLTSDSIGLDRRLIWLILAVREQMSVRVVEREFYNDFTPGTQPKLSPRFFMTTDPVAGRVYIGGTTLRRMLGRLPASDLDQAIRSLASNATHNGFEPAADGFVLSRDYLDSEDRRWRQWRG